MTFPNLPVATLRVARITQRDSDQWSNGATRGESFAPGGRLVTAGDGNMVRVDHMGHPRQAPRMGAGHSNKRRIAVPVQEERPSTCLHAHQRPSLC